MPNKKNNKFDPFQFMIENRKAIIEVINESPSLPKAWNLLSKKLPQLQQKTKFNTFKGYARILGLIEHELSQIDYIYQENEYLTAELGKVRQELTNLKEQIPNSLPNLDTSVPTHVDGWGVQRKGPYYRLFKKIGGKVKWIHIGKQWNLELANEKIKAFMKKANNYL